MQKQQNKKDNLVNVNTVTDKMPTFTIDKIKAKLAETEIDVLKRIDAGKKPQIDAAELRILKAVQEDKKNPGQYLVYDGAIVNYKDAVAKRRLVHAAVLVYQNETEKLGLNLKAVNEQAAEKFPNRCLELIDQKIKRIEENHARKAAKKEEAPAMEETVAATPVVEIEDIVLWIN